MEKPKQKPSIQRFKSFGELKMVVTSQQVEKEGGVNG